MGSKEYYPDVLSGIADDLEAMGYLISAHLLRESTDGVLTPDKESAVARHFQNRLEEYAEILRTISISME